MTESLKTLIIEYHKLIIKGYTRIFDYVTSQHNDLVFKTTIAKNCEGANYKIERAIESNLIDLFFFGY